MEQTDDRIAPRRSRMWRVHLSDVGDGDRPTKSPLRGSKTTFHGGRRYRTGSFWRSILSAGRSDNVLARRSLLRGGYRARPPRTKSSRIYSPCLPYGGYSAIPFAP